MAEENAQKELNRQDEEYIHNNMTEPDSTFHPWEITDTQYTRQVGIAYPRISYYVFDRLVPNEGWVEDTQKWQEDYNRAIAIAQTLANRNNVPYRVREVVDR